MAIVPHGTVGEQRWEGFHILCEPLQLLGIDRAIVALLGVLFYVMLQMLGFAIALVISLGLYLYLRHQCREDPHFLPVIRRATQLPAAWYDPGEPPVQPGPHVAARVPSGVVDVDQLLLRTFERELAESAGAAPPSVFSRLSARMHAVLPAGRGSGDTAPEPSSDPPPASGPAGSPG